MCSAPDSQVPRLGSAAERERDDMIDLQPITGAAAPAAVRIHIAATTLVTPPHRPLHGSRNVPGPAPIIADHRYCVHLICVVWGILAVCIAAGGSFARHRADAPQRGKVPLQHRRTPRAPQPAIPGGILQPLRHRSRAPVAAWRLRPRRAVPAGIETQFRRARCTAGNTALPLATPITRGAPLPLRQRSSPTAATTHCLRWPARVLHLAPAPPALRHRRERYVIPRYLAPFDRAAPRAGHAPLHRLGLRTAALSLHVLLRRRSGLTFAGHRLRRAHDLCFGPAPAGRAVGAPLFAPATGDSLPRSASEGRFGAERRGALANTAPDDARLCSTSLRRSSAPLFARATLRCTASLSRRACVFADRWPVAEPRLPERRARRGRSGS